MGALGRLYRRLGRHYWLLLFATASIIGVILPVLVVYVAGVHFIGISIAEFRHIAWIAVLGVQCGTALSGAWIMALSKEGFRWLRGHRDAKDAARARHDLTRLTSLFPLRGVPPIVLGSLPAVYIVLRDAHANWYQAVSMNIGNVVGIALGVAIHMALTETLLRPVLAELDQRFPSVADADIHRTVSARSRIVTSSLLVLWTSGWLSAGLAIHAHSPMAQLAWSVLTGLGIAVVFGLSLTFALSVSIFDPLRDLVNATRRVRAGDLTTRVTIQTNDEISEVARSFNHMVLGLAEREALRSAFGAYVDPSVADRLLAEGEFLKGEQVDVTVMFVDIVGFSSRAEMLPADEVLNQLNEFFRLIVPIIAGHQGHTNKLIGDGLMAVFGTPVPLEHHADGAVHAACDIQDLLSRRYNGSLCAGIGINTGTVIVGTTGGDAKLDFTVIGDAVNVASRVESLTRETQDSILLTESTRTALTTPTVALASRGFATIKGRAEPVSIYSARSWIPA